MLFMKRNERITSSWGFLTQGAKTMMCLFVLMLSVQTVFAQQFEYGGVVYDLSDGKATATKFGKKAAPHTLVIPDYVYYNHQQYPVTAIADNAFSQSKDYRKVVIGDNVTRIYSLTGQYEGTSLENLPKGIHIMNGRKFVVK